MKKFISLSLSLILILVCFCSCSASDEKSDKLSIVATVFPQYDWVVNILGEQAENANITLLSDNGVDLHSYQPTVSDLVTIATCDMFIYVGGESDSWVEDALANATNKKMIVVNLLEVLGDSVVEEETVEGMENDHSHENEDDIHESEADEHIWLSLSNAQKACEYISLKLGEIDPENASVYSQNTENYKTKLNLLNKEYEAAVNSASVDTLIFTDRFPFRYLVDDYSLNYYAAFSGCSAETEASFETVIFLAQKLNELELNSVIILDSSTSNLADTVIANSGRTDTKILTLDSMQSVTLADVATGVTYLSIMENNLEVLKEALN